VPIPAHTALLGANAATAGAFDPLSIPWHSAFWAEDPGWTNPGDGNPVTTWDDATGNGRSATQATATKRPLFRAAASVLNNQPSLEFDLTDWLAQSAFTSVATGTVVIVGAAASAAGGVFPFCDGITSGNRWLISKRIAPSSPVGFNLYSGTGFVGPGTPDQIGHLIVCEFQATDSFALDGATPSTGNAGTHAVTGFTLGSSFLGASASLNGHLGFFGFLETGTLTAGQKSNLLAWAQSHYGTP
jgi:hypothetical protein